MPTDDEGGERCWEGWLDIAVFGESEVGKLVTAAQPEGWVAEAEALPGVSGVGDLGRERDGRAWGVWWAWDVCCSLSGV